MTPLPPSSTLFPYTTLFRSGRGDFQHAIAILGGQPVLVDAFGEVEAALERAVGNLSVVVICLLGFADVAAFAANRQSVARSEEHTSELQSLRHLVCRLLLEK